MGHHGLQRRGDLRFCIPFRTACIFLNEQSDIRCSSVPACKALHTSHIFALLLNVLHSHDTTTMSSFAGCAHVVLCACAAPMYYDALVHVYRVFGVRDDGSG